MPAGYLSESFTFSHIHSQHTFTSSKSPIETKLAIEKPERRQ